MKKTLDIQFRLICLITISLLVVSGSVSWAILAHFRASSNDLAPVLQRVVIVTTLLVVVFVPLICLGMQRFLRPLRALVRHLNELVSDVLLTAERHAQGTSATVEIMQEVVNGASIQQGVTREAEAIVSELSDVLDLAMENVEKSQQTVAMASEEIKQARGRERAVLNGVRERLERLKQLKPDFQTPPYLYVALEELDVTLRKCCDQIAEVGDAYERVTVADRLLIGRIAQVAAIAKEHSSVAQTTLIAMQTLQQKVEEVVRKAALVREEGERLLSEIGIPPDQG